MRRAVVAEAEDGRGQLHQPRVVDAGGGAIIGIAIGLRDGRNSCGSGKSMEQQERPRRRDPPVADVLGEAGHVALLLPLRLHQERLAQLVPLHWIVACISSEDEHEQYMKMIDLNLRSAFL